MIRAFLEAHGKPLNPAAQFFNLMTAGSRSRPDVPENFPGAFAFGDPIWKDIRYPDARVHGWAARGHKPGTLLFSHGICENSTRGYCVGLASRAFHDFGWSVCGVDLRSHGRSHRGCPSFGVAEAWDMQAVLDYLVANGFKGPFVVAGMSLGAMAAANLAMRDDRISGAFLVNQPATPRVAIESQLVHFLSAVPAPMRAGLQTVAETINTWYGWDILDGGAMHGLRPRQPLAVVGAIGEEDHFGADSSRVAFAQCWGAGSTQRLAAGDHVSGAYDGPTFITCTGARHASNMWDWPVLMNSFDGLLAHARKAA